MIKLTSPCSVLLFNQRAHLANMSVSLPLSCGHIWLTVAQTNQQANLGENIDDVLDSPPAKQRCMCGNTFAELGEAAMRSLQTIETEEIDAMTREGSGSGASGSGVPGGRVEKEGEGRRNSGVGDRGGT